MYGKFALRMLILLGLFLGLAINVSAQTNHAATQRTGTQGLINDYQLGTGDKLHIIIFGQTDLNGDYVVDATGSVQLPLIGQVRATGRTVEEFRKDVTAKLLDGYLVNPSVSVAVINYRPFYIMGEVNRAGEYPYVNGMSILNAVALAGGYTYRADQGEAYIRRNGATKEVRVPADETTKVMPGDIIRIPERIF